MTVIQMITGKENRITYTTYGDESKPESSLLWAKDLVANILPAALAATPEGQPDSEAKTEALETVAEWYDRWVYGVDLNARSGGKVGGPMDPWVLIGNGRTMNLEDGTVALKDKDKDGKRVMVEGEVIPIARRVQYINRMVDAALESGEKPLKAVTYGRTALIAANEAHMEGGTLVVGPAVSEPAAEPPASEPAPEPAPEPVPAPEPEPAKAPATSGRKR